MSVSSPCHDVAGLIVRAGWMSVCKKSRQDTPLSLVGWQLTPGIPLPDDSPFRYTLKKWQLSPGMVATIRRNGWQLSPGMVATLHRNTQISYLSL